MSQSACTPRTGCWKSAAAPGERPRLPAVRDPSAVSPPPPCRPAAPRPPRRRSQAGGQWHWRSGIVAGSHGHLQPQIVRGADRLRVRVSRSSFYYEPQGETAMNLDLMLLIDKPFLETPFYGVRQMTWHLQNEGHAVNEKRIRRLMRLVRLMPIYQKPDTSKPAKGPRPTPICWAGCGWNGPIRSGAPTSPRASFHP